MPSEVILPRVDMDMATGKISKWLVEPNAAVIKGQPLFEIETDKATMEIEAEATGTIRDLTEAGSNDIPVGSTVAWIFADNESEKSAVADAAPPAAEEPEPSPTAAQPVQNAPVPTIDIESRHRATPLARRLARTQGIDLGRLRGSGPRGRVQAADITSLTKGTAPAPVTARAPAAPIPTTPVAQPTAPAAPPSVDLRTVHADTAVRAPARNEVERAPALTTPDAPAGSGLKTLRDGVGTPLLLVHGFGSEAATWRPLLQGWETSRPVHVLDLPGHGAAPLGSVNSFDSLVESVGNSIVDLGSVDVVAHSLGAAIMVAVAARGLADVRSLMLISPAGLGPEINGGFINGFLSATSEASLKPWMQELVADPNLITRAFVRATLRSRDGTALVETQSRLAAALFPDGTQSFSVRADLGTLRVPTRVVFGTADKIIPVRHSVALPPLVALHVLPNIGHMPYLEAGETVAAILSQAVAR